MSDLIRSVHPVRILIASIFLTAMLRRTLPALLLFAAGAFAQDVNDATEKAMKAAAAKVAPTIARIETTGGAEAIWGSGRKGPEVMFRRGTGATTGLVVDPNGYIITSTFNFVGKPTDIFVTVPGKPRVVAKVVGTDATRMLTMLKIDQTGLPVPPPFPKKEIEVGMWSIALGRTLNPDLAQPPSINGGIVSADQPRLGQGDPDATPRSRRSTTAARSSPSTAASWASSSRSRRRATGRRPASSGTTPASASPSRSRTS